MLPNSVLDHTLKYLGEEGGGGVRCLKGRKSNFSSLWFYFMICFEQSIFCADEKASVKSHGKNTPLNK